MTERVVHNLGELTRPQIEAIIDKAVIEGTGTLQLPPIDCQAIRERSEQLDAKSPHKADIWVLLDFVERVLESQ